MAPRELPAALVAEPADVPPRIDDRSVDAWGVTHTTALLSGTIERGHGETYYEFEYVDELGYDPGSACPYRNGGRTGMTSAEEGCGEQTVARALLGLLPGTTYHYRLVAITRGWDVAGSDHTFMTMPLPTRVEQKPIQNPNYNPNQNPNQKLFAEEWNDSLSGG